MADNIKLPPVPDVVPRLMPSLSISSEGMNAQQDFLKIIARNIANAETTRMPDGEPYQREVGVLRPGAGGVGGTVEVVADERPGRIVYDPGHPDANAEGFVEYPNVDVPSELVDLMMVRRLFEANATVFQAAKRMLRSALDI